MMTQQRKPPAPELSWEPGVDWQELQAIWDQRAEAYHKFRSRPPTDEMVTAARSGRVREAMALTNPTDRADAYIAVGLWDPRRV